MGDGSHNMSTINVNNRENNCSVTYKVTIVYIELYCKTKTTIIGQRLYRLLKIFEIKTLTIQSFFQADVSFKLFTIKRLGVGTDT